MSGAELAVLAPALGATSTGAAAAGASGIPGGLAGLFGATGAVSPMTASLLGPAAATPFVTEGAMLGAAPVLGLGAPPAAGKSVLGLLGKGARAAALGQQEQPKAPVVPLPNKQVEAEQFAALFDKYMSGLDPVSKRMLMSRMRGV